MFGQGNRPFPERVQHAIEAADRLVAERRRAHVGSWDITSSPEYQELVRLEVIVEREAADIIGETARISTEIERSNMAESNSSESADQ